MQQCTRTLAIQNLKLERYRICGLSQHRWVLLKMRAKVSVVLKWKLTSEESRLHKLLSIPFYIQERVTIAFVVSNRLVGGQCLLYVM